MKNGDQAVKHYAFGHMIMCGINKSPNITQYVFRATCPRCIKKVKKSAERIKIYLNYDPYALMAAHKLGLVWGDVHNPIFADDQTLEKNYEAIARKTKELL